MEAISLKLELVESLLTTIASSLHSASGIPSPDCLFNSLLAARALVGQARADMED